MVLKSNCNISWSYIFVPQPNIIAAKNDTMNLCSQARDIEIDLEGVSWSQRVTLRPAPGNCHFNFVQNILLSHGNQKPGSYSITDEKFPTGFVIQIQLLSSWGDPFYIGLNGLELYGADGEKYYLRNESKLFLLYLVVVTIWFLGQ
jgi:hypothetical protein